jgi:hypothetical protein
VAYEKIAHQDAACMIEVSPDQLKQAVESQHGGTADFVQSVPGKIVAAQLLGGQSTHSSNKLASGIIPDSHAQLVAANGHAL